MSFEEASLKTLRGIEDRLNNRPRKVLDFLTPKKEKVLLRISIPPSLGCTWLLKGPFIAEIYNKYSVR